MWWLIIGNEELWIDEPGAVDLITQADIPQWLKDGNSYDDDDDNDDGDDDNDDDDDDDDNDDDDLR